MLALHFLISHYNTFYYLTLDLSQKATYVGHRYLDIEAGK